jgi:hypothetical protein
MSTTSSRANTKALVRAEYVNKMKFKKKMFKSLVAKICMDEIKEKMALE